jgi:sugar phosphate isomerase/epimerase
MSNDTRLDSRLDRRDFFRTAGAGFAGAGLALTPAGAAAAGLAVAPQARPLTDKEKLLRIASCSYPVRMLFKSRMGGGRAGGRGAAAAGTPAGAPTGAGGAGAPAAGGRRGGGGGAAAGAPGAAAGSAQAATRGGGGGRGNGGMTTEEMKKKYGEITMLDFPQWTKDTFPGVTHMDIWSSLCGDVTDNSMFGGGGGGGGFDPSLPSSRKWIDQLANNLVKTGTKIQHISNNAPNNMASLDDAARQNGIAVARKWLDMAKTLGVVSMRVNTGGPNPAPVAAQRSSDGYPRNTEIIPYMDKCVESFKEMADYGGKVGVKVTIENHWGLAADPMRIVAIIEAVNHPYCEATPDFCNWEYEYHLFSGLKVLAPYSKSNVHAKYWERWGDRQDPARATRIMTAGGFRGTFALEYEAGPWNGVDGCHYLMKEVLAGLSTPVAELPSPAGVAI